MEHRGEEETLLLSNIFPRHSGFIFLLDFSVSFFSFVTVTFAVSGTDSNVRMKEDVI